jgi:hypothetical protein
MAHTRKWISPIAAVFGLDLGCLDPAAQPIDTVGVVAA